MYCKIELENYMSHFFVKKSITFDIQTLFYMVQFTFTVKRLHLPLWIMKVTERSMFIME